MGEIKNLIEMIDEQIIGYVLEKINEGESVLLHMEQKILMYQDKAILVIDCSSKGNPRYNAVSVIRDLLKEYYPDINWTRKMVVPLIEVR